MTTDINSLNDDAEVGADQETYEKPTGFRPLPPAEYNLIRDDTQDVEFRGMKTGDIMAFVKFAVLDGDFQGRSFLDLISSYVGKFRNASSIDDFLHACNYDVPPMNGRRYTIGEIKQAVSQTCGPFRAYVDWEAYCKECGTTAFKGHKKFPKDRAGNPNPEVLCPSCGATLIANSKVRRFVVES
jgi:hypothetical protein